MNYKDKSFQKQYGHQIYSTWRPLSHDNSSVGSTYDFNPRGIHDPPQLQQQLTIGLFLHAGEIHNGVDLNLAYSPKSEQYSFFRGDFLPFMFNRLTFKIINEDGFLNFETLMSQRGRKE